MFKKYTLALSVVVLGACAYSIDGSVQTVKFATQGAHNAACNVYVNGLKYKVKPPQSLDIYKSKEDLVVDCMAPGNRRQVVYIKPQIESSAAWNAATAGVGLAWDYASSALFKYPDVVEVNFTDTPVVPQSLPMHNNPDIRQPEDYLLEEFSPTSPRLNADRYQEPAQILRRGEVSTQGDVYDDGAAFSEPVFMGREGKGNLVDMLNPAGAPSSQPSASSDANSGPVPLYPGE